MNEQKEKNITYPYIALQIILISATFLLIGMYSPDKYIYEDIAKNYCENKTEYEFTQLQMEENPVRFTCGEETYQIIEENIPGIINFTHYEVR